MTVFKLFLLILSFICTVQSIPFSVLYESTTGCQCNINPGERKPCMRRWGYTFYRQTEKERCENDGCCFDSSINFCFQSKSVCTRSAEDECAEPERRVSCGPSFTVREENCPKTCCFDSTKYPYCFQRNRQTGPDVTSKPTTTTAPATVPLRYFKPELSQWSNWGECANECQKSSRKRNRTCLSSEIHCQMHFFQLEDSQECNISGCTKWSEPIIARPCSVTCGDGVILYTRQCEEGFSYRQKCNYFEKKCRQPSCAVSAVVTTPAPPPTVQNGWADWSMWSKCSEDCSPGQQTRTRTCFYRGNQVAMMYCNYYYAYQQAGYQETETRACNEELCSIWSLWGPDSACEATCGERAVRRSKRICRQYESFGTQEPTTEAYKSCSTRTRPCLVDPCPTIATAPTEPPVEAPDVSADWTKWSEWEKCDCKKKEQIRTRQCVFANGTIAENIRECGKSKRTKDKRDCDEDFCNLTVDWGNWSEWGTCDCDENKKSRTRTCILSDGTETDMKQCGHSSHALETERCDANECTTTEEVVADWGKWADWTACDCEENEKSRTRPCLLLDGTVTEDLSQCGSAIYSKETKKCDDDECKIERIMSTTATMEVTDGVPVTVAATTEIVTAHVLTDASTTTQPSTSTEASTAPQAPATTEPQTTPQSPVTPEATTTQSSRVTPSAAPVKKYVGLNILFMLDSTEYIEKGCKTDTVIEGESINSNNYATYSKMRTFVSDFVSNWQDIGNSSTSFGVQLVSGLCSAQDEKTVHLTVPFTSDRAEFKEEISSASLMCGSYWLDWALDCTTKAVLQPSDSSYNEKAPTLIIAVLGDVEDFEKPDAGIVRFIKSKMVEKKQKMVTVAAHDLLPYDAEDRKVYEAYLKELVCEDIENKPCLSYFGSIFQNSGQDAVGKLIRLFMAQGRQSEKAQN